MRGSLARTEAALYVAIFTVGFYNACVAFDLVIKNGLVITGSSSEVSDIGIKDGKITEIGALGDPSTQRSFEAYGLWVMPGVIDTQVHFREPGFEHKEDLESGTRAALHGGVTSVLEMPNTNPTTTNPEALQDKLLRAAGRAWCHYGFFVGATAENATQLGEYENLPGTPGIKIFLGSSTGSLLVDDEPALRSVLRHGYRRCPVHAEDEARNRERKSLLSAHPSAEEHPYLRDAESARLATERILRLSAETGRPIHVLHVSTLDELPIIARAKAQGLGTTAEVTPQHLWFAAPECYRALGTKAQMNPPIRSEEHRSALRKALQDGLFDVFGSDHAPHTLEEKAKPYPASPSGMPGVQTLLPVLSTLMARGLFDRHTLVRMLCERPAELYSIQGKGRIAVGYDADLVLFDPRRQRTVETGIIQSKCGWSPYEGESLVGWPEAVVLLGEVAIRNDERLGHPIGGMLEFG